MNLIPIKTKIMVESENLSDFVISSIEGSLKPQDGDIVVVSSKIVALSQGRVENYRSKKASSRAKELGERYNLDPGFVELVLREADEIFGGVQGAILTMKEGTLTANAGIDLSNVKENRAILWPEAPNESAESLRMDLKEYFGTKVGVILVDSWCAPLRKGTIGLSIGFAGLEPVKDVRGEKDLFGREMEITQENVGDGLATAAQIVMGETNEKTPLVVIRNSPVELKEKPPKTKNKIKPGECLFSGIYSDKLKN